MEERRKLEKRKRRKEGNGGDEGRKERRKRRKEGNRGKKKIEERETEERKTT